ncbi:stage III sporulation protein AH [Brevibacillus panacihumi W25]|uniref:Stage III sporulation protein AH n=1 Tax=Brevibacillus panacihumi W25 TaxID=1408254 RepID=V6MCB7_9BACL|nr:SpoIIIAH-like family protein [Brevibacillus panacihumi]EST56181.1 stage III sporulation protein AH [Brevibacillus panacihumi W25]
MILRKQTVWLLTMLAVMVVLSGYYLAKGPQEQVPTSGQQQAVEKQEQISGVVVESREADPAPDAKPVDGKSGQPVAQAGKEEATPKEQNSPAAVVPVSETASEIFQGYKMKREAQFQQQKDEQLAIMSSPDSSPQAVAEAKAKFEELSTQDSATTNVEEMLKASGYQDAVVFMQNDKVTVIVQKNELSQSEAVEIIAHVKEHLNVPATNVKVQFNAS